MSEIQMKALAYIEKHPGCRGSDLGWDLWKDTTPFPDRGVGSAGSNKFCRPAGAVLSRLQKANLVRPKFFESYTGWELTFLGRKKVAEAER